MIRKMGFSPRGPVAQPYSRLIHPPFEDFPLHYLLAILHDFQKGILRMSLFGQTDSHQPGILVGSLSLFPRAILRLRQGL